MWFAFKGGGCGGRGGKLLADQQQQPHAAVALKDILKHFSRHLESPAADSMSLPEAPGIVFVVLLLMPLPLHLLLVVRTILIVHLPLHRVTQRLVPEAAASNKKKNQC